MTKILITEKQKETFNKMLETLIRISKHYQTSDQIRRDSEKDYGLSFDEAIEYAYDNIQSDAKYACKGVRRIN